MLRYRCSSHERCLERQEQPIPICQMGIKARILRSAPQEVARLSREHRGSTQQYLLKNKNLASLLMNSSCYTLSSWHHMTCPWSHTNICETEPRCPEYHASVLATGKPSSPGFHSNTFGILTHQEGKASPNCPLLSHHREGV